MANLRDLGWAYFDAIVAAAPLRDVNPWRVRDETGSGGRAHPAYEPDDDTLERLLGVPVHLRATSQSGVPALALDVWVAYELRRAGFHPDRVWPRASAPRVLPVEITEFVERLPRKEQAELWARIRRGQGGAGTANLLGKNYVKQVDVVMSSWATGPELMVSTKRMDSSFGKNAANRVEESYGDAKNLRLRHPQAALGFVYALSAVALETEPDIAAWLIDLLGKLGREEDAYDAVALVLPDLAAADEPADPAPEEPAGPIEAGSAAEGDWSDDPRLFELPASIAPGGGSAEGPGGGPLEDPGGGPTEAPPAPPGVATPQGLLAPSRPAVEIDTLPRVGLRRDEVPADLDPARFFEVMCRRILDNSPVNFHPEARRRRSQPRPVATLR